MQCRKCGAAIADKALICYRCGTATTEAKYQPATTRGRRSSSRSLVIAVIIIVILALLAIYFWRTLSTAPRVSALAPQPVAASARLLATRDTEDTKGHYAFDAHAVDRVCALAPQPLAASARLLATRDTEDTKDLQFEPACRGSGWSRIAGVS
jgi:hypothetical protein